jgi:heme oxygenase
MSTAAQATESLLIRIRRETRDVHEALEKDLDFLAPDLTETRYCDLLARFYGFYAPWEARLQPWIGELSPADLALHPRLPDLASDLRFFGREPADIPVCGFVPVPATPSAALGNLYVREGAALGGKMISNHLEKSLGLSGGNGYRFFASTGRDVGRDWKRFQLTLLDHSSPAHDDEIAGAARFAFEAIHRWLCV